MKMKFLFSLLSSFFLQITPLGAHAAPSGQGPIRQGLIQPGTYDGGTTKVYIKAVQTTMPGRSNINYFGLIVSENQGGGMLAKPFKIEERGGQQAWIPIHQACTENAEKRCEFTGYLTLPARAEAYYTGGLTNSADGTQTLRLVPSSSYSHSEGRALAPVCQNHQFGPAGFRRVASTESSWEDINMLPPLGFRFALNWNGESRRDSARFSTIVGSRTMNLDTGSRYISNGNSGISLFGLNPGNFSVSQTFAGLGEVRLQLDDGRTRSGVSVDEPMNAIAIYLRHKNKNQVLMMDAKPGFDNCNMLALTFVQE